MPIYEYECPKCGRFDVLQKMSAPALKTHDACGSRVKKVMSASSFALKGSGFYINDYNGRHDAAITGRDEKKAESKPDRKDAKKSDACASCPAAKPSAA
ncbi:MAG TPA: FmdB family zinc ribbon protein [Anaeromyxobacter sp.]